MSIDAWFKPPLTVFIVWGGFVLCFLLCGSSKRLCRIFCCCECDDDIDYDEETYEHLSTRRRRELDNLRSIAILRQLARFTMVLKKENMMKQLPDYPQRLGCKEEPDDVEPGSGTAFDGDQERDCKETSVGDVELGENCTGESKDGEIESEAMGDGTQYTHVLVPYPGYDIDGTHVMELVEERSDKEKKSKSIKGKILFRKSKSNPEGEDDINQSNKDQGGESKEDECVTEVEDDAKESADAKMTEKRSVPIFCSVCLMEYSMNERVCWASNSECTHIYHEDCILQWLVSLGRKRSKRQSFPQNRNPTDKKLLDYGMECPCCRQDFVSSNLVHAPPVLEGEEGV